MSSGYFRKNWGRFLANRVFAPSTQNLFGGILHCVYKLENTVVYKLLKLVSERAKVFPHFSIYNLTFSQRNKRKIEKEICEIAVYFVATYLRFMLSVLGEYLEEVCFLLGFTANLCRAAVFSKSSPEISSNDVSVLAFLKKKNGL